MADYDDAWHEAWYRRMEEGGGTIIAAMKMRFVEESATRVVMEMPISRGVIQGTGVFAAGALMQLADVSASALCVHAAGATSENPAPFPLSVQISVNLLRNTNNGKAISGVAHRSRRTYPDGRRVARLGRGRSPHVHRHQHTRGGAPMTGELKSFDRVADVYDATRAMPDDVAASVADAIAAILRQAGETPRVIEVGIGTGRMAVPLAERGVRMTGIDIAPAMLARLLAKRRDIGVMLAEASRPPLRSGAFDASLFVHILHLVPDAEATVRATLTLVRNGGIAIAGGDDHRNSIRDEADTIIQSTVRELSGVEMGGWQPYAHGQQTFERVAREVGATVETKQLADLEQHDHGAPDAGAA